MRTYDAGGAFSAAAEIFSSRIKDLFLAALIPVAVLAVAGILIGAAAASGSGFLVFFLALVTIVLAVIAGAIATATCFRIVDAAYNGQQATLRESIDFATGRLGSVIVASILVGLAVLLGMIFCIAPGVFLLIAFAVTIPALLVEGLGATEAMGRSFNLVQGRWWATLGRLVLAYLAIWAANFVVGIVSAIAGDASWVVDIIIGIPVSALTTGFAAAVAVVVYYDLRARKEGTGMTAFPPAPAGFGAGQAPQPPVAGPPPTSVAPPGGDWSAPAPAAPQPPPAPPAPPAPVDPGTSASTGSLWSSGDPLGQPEPPAEPQWQPPAPEPPAEASDDQPPPPA